ncbi:MAG: DUF5719 family protein [Microthrixaceae bacterium]
MKTARLGVITAVVVIMVALTSWWQGAPAEGRKVSLDASVPAVGRTDALSSTWFCSAGGFSSDPAPQNLIRLTNSSAEPADVRLSAFNVKGEAGQQVVEVPGRSVHTVDVAKTFKGNGLSVMAESSEGSLTVENTLVLGDMADSVPCATHSSSAWYFPSQSTVKGAKAQLILFNPFSADAGVVITAAVPEVRSPAEWNGVVVPAGSTKVIDLSEQFERREQFSVSVHLKSGRILAETAQVFALDATDKSPAVHGLRLQPGIAVAREVWTFAGGFRDPGATEKIVLQNPSNDPTTVSVQVVPYGAGEMPPEPFEVDVPGGRYAVLDLTGEGRIPDVGFHSIRVQAQDGHRVVAVRTSGISAAPTAPPEGTTGGTRPSLDRGATTSVGSTFDSRRWLIPAVPTGPGNQPIAFVNNPHAGIVRVTVTATTDGGEAVEVVREAEVGAGDGLAIGLSPKPLAGAGLRYYTIVASEPVAVERLVTFPAAKDFSLGPALPIGS